MGGAELGRVESEVAMAAREWRGGGRSPRDHPGERRGEGRGGEIGRSSELHASNHMARKIAHGMDRRRACCLAFFNF
jgi:hypothetical protein